MKMVGMNKANDCHSELSESRVCRDNNDLKKIIKSIHSSVNPFEMDELDYLPDICNSLLNIDALGMKMHNKFVSECLQDEGRLEKAVTRNKRHTFVNQGARNKRSQNAVVKELRCTQNMFGRIGFIATKTTVDLRYLMTFPLTPVPLAFCHSDGTMVHTDESVLSSLLESNIDDHGKPDNVKAHHIDGNFLLHCLPPNLPPTFGGLSRSILIATLARQSRRVDIFFDTYEEPWIKSCEHERLGAQEVVYQISGPDQIRPKDFNKALKSSFCKQQLAHFLVKDWASDHYANLLEGREVCLGVDQQCVKFRVVKGKLVQELLPELECNHPEADTRLCLHLLDADRQLNGDVVSCAADTDILIILLHHLLRMASITVWMDARTSSKGNRRYVNVTAIGEEIGADYCKALPAFHAYTGCDYTVTFWQKGKK